MMKSMGPRYLWWHCQIICKVNANLSFVQYTKLKSCYLKCISNTRKCQYSYNRACTTFATATIAPMTNANINITPTLTLPLTMMLILIHTLPRPQNPIITLTLTLCCLRYRRRNFRQNKCWITATEVCSLCHCYLSSFSFYDDLNTCYGIHFTSNCEIIIGGSWETK